MEGFTIIDAVVGGVILLSGILAWSRGFTREALAILGWVAAAVVAFMFAPQAQPLIAQIPVLSDFLGDNCELSMIAAFTAVFALALLLVSIFAPLFASAIQRSILSGIDQVLGFVFGVARGVLLVAVALIVYDRVMVDQAVAMVDDSRSAGIFAQMEERLNEQLPDDAPGWIVARYEELMASCTATEPPGVLTQPPADNG
ncbi:MAG: CvpA family protein [Rhodobacteraceae bacterium]|nr:CvpA family protein [Paracoccaceae bacterium]